MQTKLPIGFDTWIQFYDYVNTPNLNHVIGEKFVFSAISNGKERLYKFTRSYIKAKCWEEIDELRLKERDTHIMVSALRYGCGDSHRETYRNTSSLLFKIARYDK